MQFPQADSHTDSPPAAVTARPQVRRWTRRAVSVAAVASIAGFSAAGMATVAGDVFRDPPATDASHLVAPNATLLANDALKTLAPSNEGSFENSSGPGSHFDTRTDTSIPLAQQTGNKIPTGGKPSPLFGAESFTFNMLIFEEFGTDKLDGNSAVTQEQWTQMPAPQVGAAPEQDPESMARSAPVGTDLENFLGQPGIFPFPTAHSNTSLPNPWTPEIKTFLNRELHGAPAEGRPPGEGWSHQRWNEFYPQAFFKTAQAGARVNHGMRDKRQLHGWREGTEFGPGGLYHRAAHLDGFPGGTNAGVPVFFHPKFPVQNHNSVWTFDGTMPPKLLMVRYGQPILLRHYNALPLDPSANKGFGLHTISTHMHNGHNPAESDGVASAFFFPGQFYDYRWPIQLAGYDTINTGATDPRAAFPCVKGETLWVNDANPGNKPCQVGADGKNGTIKIRGDYRETMSTQWFHDHMLDYTAQNVYKGNAVMMNYYSAIDRGNESINDGVNLRFPSGTANSWGNRDYDINIVIGDKAWDKDGQLWFNVFNKNGFLGDRLLTNFVYHPYLDVRARKYRFRLLNGSVSRYLSLALVKERADTKGEMAGPAGSGKSFDRIPFHLVANDGNILQHSVAFDGKADLDGNGDAAEHKGTLPQQAIAERYDIIVDFGAKNGINPGDKLYFVNVQEHKDPVITSKRIPLADVLSGKYVPGTTRDDDGDGVADRWTDGDPCVGKFMELRVHAYAGKDLSMDPSQYTEGKLKMLPMKIDRNSLADYNNKLKNATHRSFVFGHSGGSDEQPWTIKADGGPGYNADMRRITAAPTLSTGPTDGGTKQAESPYEIWYFQLQGGWDHPIHIHFEEGVILRRGGKAPPAWEKYARKDIFRIGPDAHATDSVEVAIQFREFAGTFVEHCHATQHEDNAMLMRFDVQRPGQTLAMPSPIPTWDGVHFTGVASLPTYKTGEFKGPSYKFGK
jgi:FtsP/CotA-like multicopper oxidase with cupredoxin domain